MPKLTIKPGSGDNSWITDLDKIDDIDRRMTELMTEPALTSETEEILRNMQSFLLSRNAFSQKQYDYFCKLEDSILNPPDDFYQHCDDDLPF